jgi:hypothetical protein
MKFIPYTDNLYYVPKFDSHDGKLTIICDFFEERKQKKTFESYIFFLKKEHPALLLSKLCAGFPIWNDDDTKIFFPIWESESEQKIAVYDITNETFLVYSKSFTEVEILSTRKNSLDIFTNSESKLFNLETENVEIIEKLPFIKHEDCQQGLHPFLNENNAAYSYKPEKDEIFVTYNLRCHIENENDRLFYWPQMEQLYTILNPIMKDWKYKRVHTDIALFRPLRPNKERENRITGKRANNGGAGNKYTLENVKKVATLFIENNPNLVAIFNNPKADLYDLYQDNPQGLPHIFSMSIYGRINSLKIPSYMYQAQSMMHFFLYYDNSIRWSKLDAINQKLNIVIPKYLFSETEMDNLVRLSFATTIYKSESAFFPVKYSEPVNGLSTWSYQTNENIENAIDGKNNYGKPWVKVSIK